MPPKKIKLLSVNPYTILLLVFLIGLGIVYGILAGLQAYVLAVGPSEYPPVDIMHLFHVSVMFVLGISIGAFLVATRRILK